MAPPRSPDREEALAAYLAMPWERSLRRLAIEGQYPLGSLWRWCWEDAWVQSAADYDLATRGEVFDRRQWRARQRRIEKWGPNPAYWRRVDRKLAQRRLNGILRTRKAGEPLGRRQDFVSAFISAKRQHLSWEVQTYGGEKAITRIDKDNKKPKPSKPMYLGSA